MNNNTIKTIIEYDNILSDKNNEEKVKIEFNPFLTPYRLEAMWLPR